MDNGAHAADVRGLGKVVPHRHRNENHVEIKENPRIHEEALQGTRTCLSHGIIVSMFDSSRGRYTAR
jgi:hypothetical protein